MSQSNPDIKINQLDADCAKIEFDSTFMQQPVRCQATIMTLEHYQQNYAKSSAQTKQFIEIPAAQSGTIKDIVIGLKISKITEAVIQQTVIMIKQYKLLAEGRHEFG